MRQSRQCDEHLLCVSVLPVGIGFISAHQSFLWFRLAERMWRFSSLVVRHSAVVM